MNYNKKVGHSNMAQAGTILSYWIVTRLCNLSCKYCVCPKLRPDPPDSTQSTIDKVIERYNYLESIKPVDLILTGGEPTLKDLPYILSKLELKNPITIFTNLQQPIQYYIDLNKMHEINIWASYHPSGQSIEEFLNKVNVLSKSISILPKFMFNTKAELTQEQYISDYLGDLKIEYHSANKMDTQLRVFLTRLNQDKSYFYGDQQLSLYELLQRNSFKGWTCTAPGNALCIDYDGKVYICKAHFQQRKPLPFTVFDNFEEEYARLPKTTICPLKRCTSELEILKYK